MEQSTAILVKKKIVDNVVNPRRASPSADGLAG